ncbi:hypothetical protein V2J09_019525 [Rumex salicifolius]
MEFGPVVVPLILLVAWFMSPYCESKLVEDEVATLERIALTMGSRYWKFNDISCKVQTVGISSDPPTASNSTIHCNCQFGNNSCHVVGIVLKGFNLPGSLPPELANLPYLRYIDFASNFLSGEIPKEWASLPLEKISLIVNRISGEIPKFLGSMTSLTYLSLESNRFSGKVPAELGNLTNMETLVLSSNQFMGSLPTTLERLTKLKDFRINDNNFSGAIPNFIRSWKQLVRLEMHASGFEGPIPPEISTLENLTRLRISDINGTTAAIPLLKNMRGLKLLVLRNCNIYGKIPAYLFNMENLLLLDLSFNKLIGEIPTEMTAKYLKVIYLSGNSLTGNIPSAMLNSGMNIDLSYNNLTRQNPNQPSCQEDLNSNINLFRSSSTDNALRRFLPCLDRVDCPHGCSFHVNCGGDDLIIKGDEGKVIYEGDSSAPAGNAIYFKQSSSNWGFSSFGDFMDDNNYQNIRPITSLSSTNMPLLYTTSRLTPVSLAYFGYCLENGNYTVTLHFAEIQFTNDNTYDSLGRRIFDIFIQDQLVQKNFNIEDEAHGARKPLIKQYTASVTDGTLEIRFYWAGKGTTRVPIRGVYGPLISAISVTSDFRHCSNGAKSKMLYIISGAAGLSLVILACFILWWKWHMVFRSKAESERDHSRTEIPKGSYSLKQIKDATDNFNIVNKIGEGGFGTVYKGLLPDGSIIAVKQLSSTSKQGNRQFLNEIAMISCLQHPNLVKLHGCCAEGNQLLLACHLQQRGEYRNFVDEKLGSNVKIEEAERMVKVALLCTNGSPSLRPAMSEVVRILEGETDVPEAIPEAGTFSDDLRFKAMRDICKQRQHEDRSISCCIYHNSTTILTTDAHEASFSATVSN